MSRVHIKKMKENKKKNCFLSTKWSAYLSYWIELLRVLHQITDLDAICFCIVRLFTYVPTISPRQHKQTGYLPFKLRMSFNISSYSFDFFFPCQSFLFSEWNHCLGPCASDEDRCYELQHFDYLPFFFPSISSLRSMFVYCALVVVLRVFAFYFCDRTLWLLQSSVYFLHLKMSVEIFRLIAKLRCGFIFFFFFFFFIWNEICAKCSVASLQVHFISV